MATNYKKYHRDKSYNKEVGLFKNIFAKRFNLLQRFLKKRKKGKVLDVGCSNGIFLDLFKNIGWETWGVEVSKSADEASKKGHKVKKSYFEKTKLPRGYFDLIILNHTLEHMDDPTKVLTKAKRLLKEDGLLFVDVPNAGGLSSRILGEKWPHRLPEEHKHQFTRKKLKEVFVESGFNVLHWESRSGFFEYANPFSELKRKRFLLDFLFLPYTFVVTLLNLGDSMSMIGAKNE